MPRVLPALIGIREEAERVITNMYPVQDKCQEGYGEVSMAAVWLSKRAADKVDTRESQRELSPARLIGMTKPEAESKTSCWHSMMVPQLRIKVALKKLPGCYYANM